MTANVAKVTVEVTPDLDGFADKIKAAIADELRRLADELTPAPSDPLFVWDDDGDRWTRQDDGRYRLDENHNLIRSLAQVEQAYGIRGREA
ncbi:hypothetical protein SEA_HONK_33 [Microbacterium phage Honk]|uniref:Uncharacterized protein n=1 Tax=Microbacterium phage Honk TaxID=2836095 RepID=A0A8F3E5K1_9CAUD|nr:hypothetical protein SEA_HONK_33 [Microbacterium phage Honk]